MTEEEDKIAFEQWLKDHGHNFPGMKKDTLYYVYRSMDEKNKREFLEEAGYINFHIGATHAAEDNQKIFVSIVSQMKQQVNLTVIVLKKKSVNVT